MEKRFILKTKKGEISRVDVHKDLFTQFNNPLEKWFAFGDWGITSDEGGIIINTREFSYSSVQGVKTDRELAEFFKVKIDGEEFNEETSSFDCCKAAGYVCLPIWGYSHSGLVFRANEKNPFEKWDSGLAGIIWLKNENGRALETFDTIVDELNAWLSGETYEADVYDAIGMDDSCISVSGIYSLEPEAIAARIRDELGLYGELIEVSDDFVSTREVADKVQEILMRNDHEFVDPMVWQQLQNIAARIEELR